MKKTLGLLVFLGLVATPALAQKITIDYAHDFDFEKIKTFQFVDADDKSSDTLMHERIKEAIFNELDGLEQVDEVELEFLDFTSLYPPRLYPGGDPSDGNGTPPSFRKVRLRRLLAWYNPLSWLWAGLTLRGRVVAPTGSGAARSSPGIAKLRA